MGGSIVAGLIDRYRNADCISHPQCATEAGVEQQELLAVGKFQRCYLGDLVKIGLDIGPFPEIRSRAIGWWWRPNGRGFGGNCHGVFVSAVMPGRFLRCIGAGPQPDMQRRSLFIQALHLR